MREVKREQPRRKGRKRQTERMIRRGCEGKRLRGRTKEREKAGEFGRERVSTRERERERERGRVTKSEKKEREHA